MVNRWPEWPAGMLVLSGPEASGKSHLAHIWASLAGAQIFAARDLDKSWLPTLAAGPLVVEDVPEIARIAQREEALFHLYNLARAAGMPVLYTGRGAPGTWGLALPDLQSRVLGLGHVALNAPDDALLCAVLAKQFHDRQLTPPPDVIPFLVTRIERSFSAARRVVAAIDRFSIEERRAITRALAGRALDNLEAGPL